MFSYNKDAERSSLFQNDAEGRNGSSQIVPRRANIFSRKPAKPEPASSYEGPSPSCFCPTQPLPPSKGSCLLGFSGASAPDSLLLSKTPGTAISGSVGGQAAQRPLGKDSVISPTPPANDFQKEQWDVFHALKRRQWSYRQYLEKHDPDNSHLETLKNHVSFKCRCGAAHGKDPGIGFIHGDLSWFGLFKCGSIWGCPICSRVLMKKHEEELAIGFINALAMGWTILFVTLTIPHKRTDDMLELMDKMDEARTIYGKGGTLSRKKKKLGHEGDTVRLEPSFGNNGIHPHLHTAMFFNHILTQEEVDSLLKYLGKKWKESCEQAGLVNKKNEKAFDLYGFYGERTSNIDKLVKYMTKTPKSVAGLAKEMTNASDAKKGRGCSDNTEEKAPWGRSQSDVMRGFIAGDPLDTELWLTFLKAFHRKSAIRWSPGLKEKLSVEQDNREDVDKVKIDETDKEAIVPVYQVPAGQYGKVVRNGLWHPILSLIKNKDFDALQGISDTFHIDFLHPVDACEGYPKILSKSTLIESKEEDRRVSRREAIKRSKAKVAEIKARREAKEQARQKAERDYRRSLLPMTDYNNLRRNGAAMSLNP